MVRAGTPPAGGKLVHYDPALAGRLGGVAVQSDAQRRILESLGFTIVALDGAEGEEWSVTAPGWRPDIDGAPDLVEEVIRIHGLDNIASVALPRPSRRASCRSPDGQGCAMPARAASRSRR